MISRFSCHIFFKQKPNTASKQPNVSSAYIANLTSISQNCSHPANEEKSRRLAQMRAKNAATGATTTTSNGVKLGKLQMPIRGLASGTKPVELKLAPGPSSSFKVKEYQAPLILSPMSTYEISDKEEDSESDCESDDEYYNKKPKKKIPSWASRDNLNPQVETQFQLGGIDPDEIFGEVETCNLQEIFSRKKSRYIKRTSSGNWCRDRATAAEKRAYKRNMQYIESSSLSSLS